MLYGEGINVIVCDKRNESKIDKNILENLKKKCTELRLGGDYLKNLEADVVIRTPGMNFLSSELIELRKQGAVVTSEMEIFFDLCPCKIIGITGSDGKTTVTSIITQMLRQQGITTHLGGNIGQPLLPKINQIKKEDIAVVELSSFQLISMRKSPEIAVVTNLSPNHLDIHKDMDEYIDAKKQILLHQNAFSKAVLNFDNDITNNMAAYVRGEICFFSRRKKQENGVWVDGNSKIIFSCQSKDYEIMDAEDIKIPGKHNLENCLAATCALWGIVDAETMKKTAQTFSGVEHRIEFVKTINGVSYYNDSIASSPTRTISGMLSLFDDKKIILIAGGYDKKNPFDELAKVIIKKVSVLILMGDSAEKIEKEVESLNEYRWDNPLIIKVNNMEEAVNVAKNHSNVGNVIALSPACASFGLYTDFEERGNHFKKIVLDLK